MLEKIRHLFCTENILAVFIIAVMALILLPLSPRPNSGVSGILLPSHPLSPPSSPISAQSVHVFDVLPPSAQIIGRIHTKVYFSNINQQENDRNLKASLHYAQVLAAQAGANAIVIDEVGLEGVAVSPLDGFVLHATAIQSGSAD